MARYIAFFSSINVGSNRLTMADLRYAFEREEFENVETVVASGNVLFDYDDRPSDGLEELLGHMMADRFDMDSFAAVRNAAEVRQAIEGNPFSATGEENQVHTHFLSQQPAPDRFDDLFAAYAGRGPERLAAGPRSLYVDYVNGVGASRLTGPFIERRLGCRGTARNMRSLRRILEKMED
ncbi:DUF1697 domain-containing protein [Novosphingobium umbonatum]|uniref:DUF1697 domain-containing protein n=1 Tax=Novosphingobium umbonatum TaxID=1908524 RepID=A0A3S2VBI8_9SPHN|nr:DUF1697 domain-containing protein [Novosphingobium umbonatum]RVU03594.1 DUF1697 domain-containing protein [Novosphingobium umbonatum]